MTTTYKIYPAIGIARVGNSESEFYVEPQTYRGLPTDPVGGQPVTHFRDPEGKLKRQAASFTVYRFDGDDSDATGSLVTVGQDDIVDIEWTVYIANKKAIWYTFDQLEGEHGYKPTHPRRNSNFVGNPELFKTLITDPGPLTVSAAVPQAEFAKGKAQNNYPQSFPPADLAPCPINSLGEIRRDESGRLFVLGGFGNTGFSSEVVNYGNPHPHAHQPTITTYANNDGWFDDVSDGSVTARVVYKNGTKVEVDVPSWVIVAPPGFAPQVPNAVTLYDTLYDVFVREMNFTPELYHDGNWNEQYLPEFNTEIKPIFTRPECIKWVVSMQRYAHLELENPLLGDPNADSRELRQNIFNVIRPPDSSNEARQPGGESLMMPFQPGDNPFKDDTTGQYPGPRYLTITRTQYFILSQWVQGKFRNEAPVAGSLPSYQNLDRAILGNCVGGPFCPGIEITWIARNKAIYAEPFRIKHRPLLHPGLSLNDHFEEGQEPGDLSKRMALPWQADFHECSTQDIPVDGFTQGRMEPFWWPAQRPLTVQLGDHAMAQWARGINEQDDPGDLEMVTRWKGLGFVINQGTDEDPNYMEVDRNDSVFES